MTGADFQTVPNGMQNVYYDPSTAGGNHTLAWQANVPAGVTSLDLSYERWSAERWTVHRIQPMDRHH